MYRASPMSQPSHLCQLLHGVLRGDLCLNVDGLEEGWTLSMSNSPFISQTPLTRVSRESMERPARQAFLTNITFSHMPTGGHQIIGRSGTRCSSRDARGLVLDQGETSHLCLRGLITYERDLGLVSGKSLGRGHELLSKLLHSISLVRRNECHTSGQQIRSERAFRPPLGGLRSEEN